MANKVIVTRSKLDSLAESISNKSGAELPLTIAEMIYEVDNLVLNTQIIQVGSGAYLDENNNIVFVNGDGESATLGTKTITTNGTYNASSDSLDGYSSVTVNVSSQAQPTQTKTATPTESQQTISPDSGYLLSSVTVNAISSTYVGTGIARKSSSDAVVDGPYVDFPAGYYAEQHYGTIPSGTEGIPIATKGTVSNHSISITPSVINSEGFISGSTKTGTSVTVTASELASGNKAITSNGTDIDVVGYSTVSVAVPADEPNLQAKTGIAPTTSSQTITADSGYDGLSSVQINAMPTMTLPTSASSSATSGYTSKATIGRSTSAQYINIPTGYNSAGAYYTISATPDGTVTAPSTISGTSATVSTGTNTLTLTKTISVTPNVTTAGYISSGTAGNSSVSLTASVNMRSSSDLTVSGATVTAPAGYYSAAASKSVSSMTLPTSTVDSASGPTVATINRNTRDKCLNIPVGYNAEEATYIIAATPDMTLPTSATTTHTGTFKVTIPQSTTQRYLNIPVGYNSTTQYYQLNAMELTTLTITENGTYNAASPYDVDGFSSVTVAIPFSTVTVSSSNPSGGSNGDIWIKVS